MTESERQAKILANKPLVAMMVRKAMGLPHVKISVGAFEEAYQIGFVGLCKAVDAFDPKKGFTFATYATRVIWREITDVASSTALIKVPHNAMRENSPKHLVEMACRASKIIKLGIPVKIPCHRNTESRRELCLERDEIRSEVVEALAKCSDGHCHLLSDLFGINSRKEKNLSEVAKEKGVTKQRMAQIKDEALDHVRDNLWHMVCYM